MITAEKARSLMNLEEAIQFQLEFVLEPTIAKAARNAEDNTTYFCDNSAIMASLKVILSDHGFIAEQYRKTRLSIKW